MAKQKNGGEETGLSIVSKNQFVEALENLGEGLTAVPQELFELAEQIQETDLSEIQSRYKEFEIGVREAFIFEGIEQSEIKGTVRDCVALKDKFGTRWINAGKMLVSTFKPLADKGEVGGLYVITVTGEGKSAAGTYQIFKVQSLK